MTSHGDKVVAQPSGRLRQTRYQAAIKQVTIEQFPSGIRMWDTPQSAVSGARVVHSILTPAQVEVVAEQCEPFSHTPERAKIRYDGLEGWVLAMALTPVT